MRTIGEGKFWSFYDGSVGVQRATTPTIVRKESGHIVNSYLDLATKVAELQFRNPNFVLMFRGQSGDWKNAKNNTTLKPSLFRSAGTNMPLNDDILKSRYQTLENAESSLVAAIKGASMIGWKEIERYRILRWAILQHYDVCRTPLLDVTHSLRIAASFASQNEKEIIQSDCFLFVIGIPNLSGAITASADAGLQTIRLSSVCPPTALRPHVQEGYLLGEYPDMISLGQKQFFAAHEIDFGRRLIAKFRFEPKKFWGNKNSFPLVPWEALYPSAKDDPLRKLTEPIIQDIMREDAGTRV